MVDCDVQAVTMAWLAMNIGSMKNVLCGSSDIFPDKTKFSRDYACQNITIFDVSHLLCGDQILYDQHNSDCVINRTTILACSS